MIISESVEVLLIRLSYCKISPYWHLVTAVTVTVVTKVSYVWLERQKMNKYLSFLLKQHNICLS